MDENSNKIPDYVTFGKTFEKYKWYKPILVFVIGLIIYGVLQGIILMVCSGIYGMDKVNLILSGGYDVIDTSDVGFYVSYISVIIFAPALYISSRIVKDIIPLQCIAEEHVFRGLFMQTLGSWFNIPVLAVILQSIIFALAHPYNILGVIGILISGLAFGFLAWKSNGLESASALHTINNLMGFYTVALGYDILQNNITNMDFISGLVCMSLSTIIIYYIGTKYEWFNEKTNENKISS